MNEKTDLSSESIFGLIDLAVVVTIATAIFGLAVILSLRALPSVNPEGSVTTRGRMSNGWGRKDCDEWHCSTRIWEFESQVGLTKPRSDAAVFVAEFGGYRLSITHIWPSRGSA
jgi:hypothetical protein